jgi:hypothetical protein
MCAIEIRALDGQRSTLAERARNMRTYDDRSGEGFGVAVVGKRRTGITNVSAVLEGSGSGIDRDIARS